jgi:hypothetical protein
MSDSCRYVQFVSGDADDLLDRLGLVEHAQHEVGNVGAGDAQAAAEIAPVGGAVGAGQRPLGQAWRPDDSPVQATATKEVLHQGEVGVALAQRGLGQGSE